MSPIPSAAHVSTPAPQSNNIVEVAVVCAWPVSGQYGPGSRVLYYVLVALCIFGRKEEWLRNAALAVALVLPGVAALHGIVLAAVHVDGRVDMDIYGAFQLCAIGILAAPTTVRLSKTFQKARGRNAIFPWTALMVAGLLSLIVEFYRATPIPCTQDDLGRPFTGDPRDFLKRAAACGLHCTETDPPFSPMRGGAARNIYPIPAPDKLTFNTALVIGIGCCIPAILSLAFTSIQDLENSYRRRFGDPEDLKQDPDQPISGTHNFTLKDLLNMQEHVRHRYQYWIEVPLFGTAVLAILVLGELNFFSPQVSYETEPFASIGQWGPIAGTALAAFGTLYSWLASKYHGHEEEVANPSDTHSDVCDSGAEPRLSTVSQEFPAATRVRTNETNRERVGTAMENITSHLSIATHRRFGADELDPIARLFPRTPGEHLLNPNLPRIHEVYDPETTNNSSEPRLGRSRASSFSNVSTSGLAINTTEAGPSRSPTPSGRRHTVDRTPSPNPSSPRTAQRRSTVDGTCSSPTSLTAPTRSYTLEVPQMAYLRPPT